MNIYSGDIHSTTIATESKKDDCAELANVTMPTNPRETGNLWKSFNCKD